MCFEYRYRVSVLQGPLFPVMSEPAAAFVADMQRLDLAAHFAETTTPARETMRPFPGCLLLTTVVCGSARSFLVRLLYRWTDFRVQPHAAGVCCSSLCSITLRLRRHPWASDQTLAGQTLEIKMVSILSSHLQIGHSQTSAHSRGHPRPCPGTQGRAPNCSHSVRTPRLSLLCRQPLSILRCRTTRMWAPSQRA